MSRASSVLAVPLLLLGTPPAGAASPPALVWHVESRDGEVIDSREGDRPINPASIVKLATSLWALEELGPGHRYATEVGIVGDLDLAAGELDGDLVFRGGGDPDFHFENVFLVAAELNRLGLRRVRGDLVVDGLMWMDWEGGSEGTEPDPSRRGREMARRLRAALDPGRWTVATRRAWSRLADRRGMTPGDPPSVTFGGGVRHEEPAPDAVPLVVHRSKPLTIALRRFNVYSNNDIERIAALLGTPAELAARLADRWKVPPESVRLSSTSGLGVNRMTPRGVVRLLRDLLRRLEAEGLDARSVLPVAGCDPGTLADFFPALSRGPAATSLVGKTGTLIRTDGGVSVLAGTVKTGRDELLFCVAAPRSGGNVSRSRSAEEAWLLDLIARHGGPHPRTCPPVLPAPDAGAEIGAAPGVE